MSPLRVRIAVTGVGMVTPAGIGRESSWRSILQGRRCVQWLDTRGLPPGVQPARASWFGAPVAVDAAGESRLTAFAVRAAREAVEHAGLDFSSLRDSACVIGTSKSDLCAIDEFLAARSNSLAPFVLFPSQPASTVARTFGCRSAVLSPVAACATGLVSVIRAADLIRQGVCEIALAGGTDASLHAGLLASYRRLRVLADPGNDPGTACKPFDAQRSGFAVGEGSAVLVLESWQSATRRGAQPLAEWIDGTIASDPSGLTSIDISGVTLSDTILRLLQRTELSPKQIQAVNFHGTATRMNDFAEARAFHRVFGDFGDEIQRFALKGALGHLMGAAGAVETAASVLALRDQIIPPTVNHDTTDTELQFRLESRSPTPTDTDHLLKISLGFGGHIAIGVLKRTL